METKLPDQVDRPVAHRSLGKLISFIGRSIHWVVAHDLEHIGLGSGTYNFLRIVHTNPGITQNELSEFSQVDKATVAKGLAKLESQGYLARVRDTRDRRVRRLRLTDAGESIIPTVYETLRHVTEICTADLNDQEVETLFSLLDRVEEALTAHINAAKGEVAAE